MPRVYIECTRDRAITIGQQRRMWAARPCEQVLTIESDHSPFLCAPRGARRAPARRRRLTRWREAGQSSSARRTRRPSRRRSAAGLFSRLRDSLGKSRRALTEQLAAAAFDPGDDEAWERLEEALIAADVGVPATAELVRRLEARPDLGELGAALTEEVEALLGEPGILHVQERPSVILVVGVNGTGKTTTIGKLAKRLSEHGHSVLVAAADTFRAAAEEQLEIWAKRADADFVGSARGGDPAAVAYDAIEAAQARGRDIVIVDTAGRLHTQSNLMEELAKVRRVIEGRLPGAPHETLLVVDATTGQNGLQQARLFGETAGVTRRRADEARRLGQGRRRDPDRLRARPAGEADRRGGDARRISARSTRTTSRAPSSRARARSGRSIRPGRSGYGRPAACRVVSRNAGGAA